MRFWQRQGSGVEHLAGVARAEEETGTQRILMMGQVLMALGMLGWRQVTPRWENYPVWLHGGRRRKSGQGRVQSSPPEGNQAEGGEGWSAVIRMKYLRNN